ILNRALFTRITIDDEENATYSPDETTASVLAHTSIDAPAHVTAETKLPRHQAGQVSIFSSYVELRGFEPLTSSMPRKRATNCAIAPCGMPSRAGSTLDDPARRCEIPDRHPHVVSGQPPGRLAAVRLQRGPVAVAQTRDSAPSFGVLPKQRGDPGRDRG